MSKFLDFASKPYKIPVGWFLLEQDIRMLADKGVISLQKCQDIATRLKINADNLVPALKYLDELNILLYYPSLLPGVIFAEPQTLLNKLTELVAYSYKLRCGQINEPLTGEWKRFQDEGVVTFQMLQDEEVFLPLHIQVFLPPPILLSFSKAFSFLHHSQLVNFSCQLSFQ